jgi:hypothetical protein
MNISLNARRSTFNVQRSEIIAPIRLLGAAALARAAAILERLRVFKRLRKLEAENADLQWRLRDSQRQIMEMEARVLEQMVDWRRKMVQPVKSSFFADLPSL